jgi:hypothetical protein
LSISVGNHIEFSFFFENLINLFPGDSHD